MTYRCYKFVMVPLSIPLAAVYPRHEFAVVFGLIAGPWIALAVTVAVSNSLVELYSPRGTDDFTMATINALLCLAFGAWLIH